MPERDLSQLIYDELIRMRGDVVSVREEQSAHGERFAGIERRIDEQRNDIAEMRKAQSVVGNQIAGLRVKSGVWGVIGGLVVVGLPVILWAAGKL
jgi:hypothetical protein